MEKFANEQPAIMNSQLLVHSQSTEYWTFGLIVKISNVLSADKRSSSSFIVIFGVGVGSKLDGGNTPSGGLSKLILSYWIVL